MKKLKVSTKSMNLQMKATSHHLFSVSTNLAWTEYHGAGGGCQKNPKQTKKPKKGSNLSETHSGYCIVSVRVKTWDAEENCQCARWRQHFNLRKNN